tara:strand:- start:38 stop:304 length:267 start_codon:yes stop_codon:yes gene_type:complete
LKSIKAQVKIGIRTDLALAPNQKRTLKHQVDEGHHSLYLGWEAKDGELIALLPRYDEEGDPITETYIDEIVNEVQAIIDEHNAAIENE